MGRFLGLGVGKGRGWKGKRLRGLRWGMGDGGVGMWVVVYDYLYR